MEKSIERILQEAEAKWLFSNILDERKRGPLTTDQRNHFKTVLSLSHSKEKEESMDDYLNKFDDEELTEFHGRLKKFRDLLEKALEAN